MAEPGGGVRIEDGAMGGAGRGDKGPEGGARKGRGKDLLGRGHVEWRGQEGGVR